MVKQITNEHLDALYKGIFMDNTCWFAQADWYLKQKKYPCLLVLDTDFDNLQQRLFDEGVGLKDYHKHFNQLLETTIEWYSKLPDNIEIIEPTENSEFVLECIRLVQKHILLDNYTIIKAKPLELNQEPICEPQIVFGDEFYEELLGSRRYDTSFIMDANRYHRDQLDMFGKL